MENKDNNVKEKPQYGVADMRTYHRPQPNKALAFVIYLLMITLGTSLIIMGVIGLNLKGDDYKSALEIIQITDVTKFADYNQNLVNATEKYYGIGCFFGYLVMFVGVVWFMRDELYADFDKLKKNKKFYLITIPVLAIAFVAVVYAFQLLWDKISTASENQAAIEGVINYGGVGGILMMLSTVLFAPAVEELIFRKMIFSVLGKWSKVSAYITSILAFALIHMISKNINWNWFVNLLAYLVCSAGLTVIFERSKQNVFSSIAAHTLNNIVACIIVIVSMR